MIEGCLGANATHFALAMPCVEAASENGVLSTQICLSSLLPQPHHSYLPNWPYCALCEYTLLSTTCQAVSLKFMLHSEVLCDGTLR